MKEGCWPELKLIWDNRIVQYGKTKQKTASCLIYLIILYMIKLNTLKKSLSVITLLPVENYITRIWLFIKLMFKWYTERSILNVDLTILSTTKIAIFKCQAALVGDELVHYRQMCLSKVQIIFILNVFQTKDFQNNWSILIRYQSIWGVIFIFNGM